MRRYLLLAFLFFFCCRLLHGQEGVYVKIPSGFFDSGTSRILIDVPFLMGATEVTVAEFSRFTKATGYRTFAERTNAKFNWRNPLFRTKPNQPVVAVTYADAEAFCKWAGGRLPTEMEWEYAARAGASTRHFWGDELDERFIWYRENSLDGPHAVGTKPANPWGLYDVEGNVWEWVEGERRDGDRMVPQKVFRGGSWMTCPAISPWRIDEKTGGGLTRVPITRNQDAFDDDIGFRCVKNP